MRMPTNVVDGPHKICNYSLRPVYTRTNGKVVHRPPGSGTNLRTRTKNGSNSGSFFLLRFLYTYCCKYFFQLSAAETYTSATQLVIAWIF